MIRNVLNTLGSLRVALLAGVGIPFLMTLSAYAQNPAASPGTQLPENGPGPAAPPAPQSAGEASTERVVVTGSYIPTAEEVTASPLDTLTTQEIKRAGTQDVLTILQKRNPDFIGAGNIGNTNANVSSGATQGGALITIRGLPTLVLFQGRRIADDAAIATGGFQFSDVNLFPAALISRIEVLKDGASALYGSEAVGGVVNIFLKEDFDGVEIGARYGFTVESAVAERRAYVIAGAGNDTTHVTAGFQYLEEDGLFERERAYSRVPGGVTTSFGGVGRDSLGNTAGSASAGSFYLLGNLNPAQPFAATNINSPFDVPGVVRNGVPPPVQAPGVNQGQYAQLGTTPGTPPAYRLSSLGEVTSYDLSTRPTSTLDFSNTNAYASFTHQIFGKSLELFGDFLYAKDHNLSFLNAQPLTNATGVVVLGTTRVDPVTGALVPENRGPSAVFTPFQLSIDQFTNSGRNRLTAANRYQQMPRTFLNDTNFYRFLGGLRSQITPDWTAEAATYYSHYSIDFVNSGLVNATNLNAAIAAQDAAGNPIQGETLDFFALNPVGTGPGQLTPANFANIFGSNIRKQDSYQEVFDGRIVGFPFSLPGGKVGLSLGAEYREEGFKVTDSPEIFIGSVPIGEINAGRSIYSFYGELSVPIIGPTMQIPFVYSLELNLAGRYDHYEGVDEDAKVPKITLRYQPIKDLTLRATYSNSFVAPTLYQLFGPVSTGFSTSISFNGVQQDQAQVQTGSNPNLTPSTAESYTAGLVYSPSFVPGLVISVDYFRTLQQQIVSTLGGTTILTDVENKGTASPYVGLVAFNNFPGQPGAQPVTGAGQLNGNLASVFYLDTNINIGAARVEGFDLSARYNLDLQRFGQIELGINSIVFTKNDLKRTPQSSYYNISGLDFAEGGGGNPDYKLTFLAEYRFQGATLSFNANYIPDLGNAVGRDPETEDQGTFERIEDYITVDGRLSYTFKGKTTPGAVADAKDGKGMMDGKGGVAGAPTMSPVQRLLDGTTLTVGCNNLFDEDPPFVAGANSATDLSIYDPFGRFVYFEITKKF